jgi:hypothetical protein
MPHFKRKRRRQRKADLWRAKQLYRTADRLKARRQWKRDEPNDN